MEDCSIGLSAVVRVQEQTLEAFVVASHWYAKFDCPLACQNFSPLATAQDCETGLLLQIRS